MPGRARFLALGFLAVATGAAVVVTACGLEVVGQATDGGAAPGPDRTSVPPTPTPQPTSDQDAPPVKDVCGALDGRGPKMVQLSDAGPDAGGFCIDSTEVTVGQFKAFLDAAAPLASLPVSTDAGCAVPTSNDTAGRTDGHPVTNVTWCDAVTFCEWAGKRLCSGLDTGEHMNACTGGPPRLFPNDAGEAACNMGVGAAPTPQAQAVPAKDGGCEGTPPGVYDLAGNVFEWTAHCEGTSCEARGGSYQSITGNTCGYAPRYFAGTQLTDIGFRCCR